MPTVVALPTGAMNRASEAVTVHAHGIARATVVSDANGRRTRYHPRLALRLRSSLVPAPSPAAVPGGPDKDHASRAVMVFASSPALSRPCGVASAPGQPRSGFRGVALGATSSSL